MDSARLEALVLRLVHNPHDEAAIAEAHAEGLVDPKAYAQLLERVGAATSDPALASYWLTEAANVWVAALGDAHRAARTLMLAIERDPLQPVPAERLAELYRQKGDNKALAALLERRTKALLPMAAVDVPVREQLATIFEELGRLWTDPPLANPEKAIEHFRRALDYDPANEFAIYSLRELLKAQGMLAESLPLYETERALTTDRERKLALFADEGEVRQRLFDWSGAVGAFRQALGLEPKDASLRQQLATVVLEQVRAGHVSAGQPAPTASELDEAAGLFVGLSEEFGGEHGFLYALCALELKPGDDRSLEIALTIGESLGRLAEVAPHATAYVRTNPKGRLAVAAERAAATNSAQAAPAEHADGAGEFDALLTLRPQQADSAHNEPAGISLAGAGFSPFGPGGTSEANTVMGEAVIEEILKTEQARTAKHTESTPQAPAVAPTPAAAVAKSPLESLLSQAAALATKNRKNEAYKFYREALDLSPAEPEAIAFMDTHLKRLRKFAELRDLLWAASTAAGPGEPSTSWLREVAALSETQLRDIEGAIGAWQRIHQFDAEAARGDLKRLLTQGSRWEELAGVLVQQVDQTDDPEARIVVEKELAELYEQKRGDNAAAGACWVRIAGLDRGNEDAVWRAVNLFEKAGQVESAASAIASNVHGITDTTELAKLYKKLGALRETMGDLVGAGEALREGALESKNNELWELAEAYFVRAQAWDQASLVVRERAQGTEGRAHAALIAREAGYALNAADRGGAVALLERASELDPESAEIAQQLEQLFADAGHNKELVQFLLRRAEGLADKNLRINLRRRAAVLQRDLGDRDGARESLELTLQDREDPAVLTDLAVEAEERGEADRAVDYYKRLADTATDPAEKAQMILRQAKLLLDPLGELEGAIDCYRLILDGIDPNNLEALNQLADVELQRGEYASAAVALESLLKLAASDEQRLSIAQRLAELYDKNLTQDQDLMRVLALVHSLDQDDFEAVGRLCQLAEKVEDWKAYVEYTGELIAVEGDEEELSRLTLRLSEVLQDKLNLPDDALKRLGEIGDSGDKACRNAFVHLGDKLDKPAEVADRLVAWYRESAGSPERTHALHEAFDRFVLAGKDESAAQVARELARTRAAHVAIAERLEQVATRLHDLDALAIAHGLLVRNLNGLQRVEEMVRQSEGLAAAGVAASEAVLHGEQALTSMEPGDVEPLLARLVKLVASSAASVVDLYERQVARCKSPADRLRALARAAQVAAEQGLFDRAMSFFELALAAGAEGETLEVLERAARESDTASGKQKLTTTLAEALAAGGQGVRDAGRTRAALLRRAAAMALYELSDSARAFEWIAESLIAHVTDETLEALIDMGRSEGDFNLVEAVLGRAISEVSDGPLVRKLLGTRGRLRRDELSNIRGAAEDLKRLHALSPGDSDVVSELSALYTALEDYRGMVQLFEDQILRSKDQALRADLAREVALLWRDKLSDARETADAWRRVLRLRTGDAEATEGLTAAKQAMLKQRSAESAAVAAAPVDEPAPPEAKVSSEAKGDEPPARGGPASATAEDDAVTIAPPMGDLAETHSEYDVPLSNPPESSDAAETGTEADSAEATELNDRITGRPD